MKRSIEPEAQVTTPELSRPQERSHLVGPGPAEAIGLRQARLKTAPIVKDLFASDAVSLPEPKTRRGRSWIGSLAVLYPLLAFTAFAALKLANSTDAAGTRNGEERAGIITPADSKRGAILPAATRPDVPVGTPASPIAARDLAPLPAGADVGSTLTGPTSAISRDPAAESIEWELNAAAAPPRDEPIDVATEADTRGIPMDAVAPAMGSPGGALIATAGALAQPREGSLLSADPGEAALERPSSAIATMGPAISGRSKATALQSEPLTADGPGAENAETHPSNPEGRAGEAMTLAHVSPPEAMLVESSAKATVIKPDSLPPQAGDAPQSESSLAVAAIEKAIGTDRGEVAELVPEPRLESFLSPERAVGPATPDTTNGASLRQDAGNPPERVAAESRQAGTGVDGSASPAPEARSKPNLPLSSTLPASAAAGMSGCLEARAPNRQLAPNTIASLLISGRKFLAKGDVARARVAFRAAAEACDPYGAFALGATYDPNVLPKIGKRAIAAEIGSARFWYEWGKQLGSAEASDRLQFLAKATPGPDWNMGESPTNANSTSPAIQQAPAVTQVPRPHRRNANSGTTLLAPWLDFGRF